MIAFALRETGRDPSWIVGGEVPQLGANAGAGEGWLVVEGDESDRSVAALRPRVAVVTNIDLDHHAEFGSRAEVEELFERWLARGAGGRAGLGARAAGGRSWRCPASTTAATRRRRWRRSSWRASRGPRRLRRSRRSRASAGGSSSSARRAASTSTTTTRTTRQKVRAALATARERSGRTRARALPAAPLLPDAPLRGASSGAELAAADVVAVADVYPAREQPLEGVTGKLVVDALCDATARVRAGLDAAARGRREFLVAAGAARRPRAHGRRGGRRPSRAR